MRRRTRKMSNRRPVVYLAIIAAGVLLNFIYDNYAPQPFEAAAPETESAPVPAPTDLTVYRTGWAELPAERADDDLTTPATFSGRKRATPKRCATTRRVTAAATAAPCGSRRPCTPPIAPRRDARIDSVSIPRSPSTPSPCCATLTATTRAAICSVERTVTREANAQTFYASNIAPQLGRGFNAANGAWNNLEIFVDRQICADTLYVVTGCLFADYTDAGGRTVEASATHNKNDGAAVAVPTAYYKALLRTRAGDTGRRAADCKSSELKCAAFVVGHYDAKGRKPSAADMMSVAELERLTGEIFFANIPAAPKHAAAARDWGL